MQSQSAVHSIFLDQFWWSDGGVNKLLSREEHWCLLMIPGSCHHELQVNLHSPYSYMLRGNYCIEAHLGNYELVMIVILMGLSKIIPALMIFLWGVLLTVWGETLSSVRTDIRRLARHTNRRSRTYCFYYPILIPLPNLLEVLHFCWLVELRDHQRSMFVDDLCNWLNFWINVMSQCWI